MSTVDDPQFLLRHLRTCFITSDDSGLCELLVEPDLLKDDRRKRSNSRLSSNSHSGSEQDVSVSPDILSDMDYGGGRLRSSTALRIEKIKQEKTKRSKIKSVKWRYNDASTEPDEATVEEMFSKKEIIPRKAKKSALSVLLKLSQEMDPSSVNAFDEYKQFDGETHVDKKAIDIYMTMEDKATTLEKVLPIVVVTMATVEQTIGLACWKYTNEGRKPQLTKELELFSLHMTEDDGEVDDDFPALANKEPISKFGFARLALLMKKPAKPAVQKAIPARVALRPTRSVDPHLRQRKVTTTSLDRNSQLVTVHIPDHGSTKLFVDVVTVTVGQLLQMVQERRNLFSVTNEKFQLGDNFNQKLNDELLIGDIPCREFYMTCSRAPVGPRVVSMIDSASTSVAMVFPDIESVSTTDESDSSSILIDNSTASTTSETKTYSVSHIAKLFSIQVYMTISPGGIEIQPVNTKSAIKSMLLTKNTEIDCGSILACAITKSRSSGKSVFSLHYNGGDTTTVRIQQHNFEAIEPAATEIVKVINDMINKGEELPSRKVQKQRRQSSMY